MREILFRGYNKNIKRFIFGDLIHFENEFKIIDKSGCNFFVEPETVAQFTGKHDTNGKMIFEKDKIKWADEDTIYEVEFEGGSFICLSVDTSFNLSDYADCEYELI